MKFKYIFYPVLFIVALLVITFCSEQADQNATLNLLKPEPYRAFTLKNWAHHGPGKFYLNDTSGVLKSHDGMGLLYYSKQKFSDFILELDYKTDHIKTNSGIFVRVPKLDSTDNYIHKSFEIQIYDAGEGKNATGAIYDAHAPATTPFKAPGEWNHLKIICIEDSMAVELNNTLVNTWKISTPVGKIETWQPSGYVGLQNHDKDRHVYFRNIELTMLEPKT
jgi:hypothetical protein